MYQKTVILQLSLAFAMLLAGPCGVGAQTAAPAPEPASPRGAHELVVAREHMVVAANPHASEAGLAVLRAGGTAIDAAIAVQLVLNVVEPQSSGLGGGAFLLVHDPATGAITTLDGRERAPAAAGPDLFLQKNGEPMAFWDAVIGGRSVGVPGTPALLEAAHGRWGRLPWADLFEPAIDLARDGFAISPRLAQSIEGARGLDSDPDTFAYFHGPDGAPKPAGTILLNPDLARTLETIAEGGAAAFYRGALAQAIVDKVRASANPGLLSLDDLAGYAVIERPPVCAGYRGFLVCGMGPPSSGGLTVGQILGILGSFDMAAAGPGAQGAHLLLEASRLAFADRALYMADADFVPVPSEGLLDPGYLAQRAALIDPGRSMGTAPAGDPPRKEGHLLAPDASRERPGTSHFVIVDKDGLAVSMTTTIESGFGSRLMVGGFLLNNELTDFSFLPEEDGRPVANRVEPGKRPRSSMAPTIVLDADGAPSILIGSPGGSRIIGYVAKSLVAMIDWGMDPQAAIDMGHMINRNGASELELGTEVTSFERALAAMGHEITIREQGSGLHAIRLGREGFLGAADPRREGVALGD